MSTLLSQTILVQTYPSHVCFIDPCDSLEWHYYKGYCYWSSIYHQNVANHRNNWYGAARECRRKKADLVSIHDAGENHLAFRLSRCGDAWTGLTMVDYSKKNKSRWLRMGRWFDKELR